MRGTHLEVEAGRLRIHVYNRGMDDHDLARRRRPRRAAHRAARLGRRCRARRRLGAGPVQALLLALRRHARLARGQGHGLRPHSAVIRRARRRPGAPRAPPAARAVRARSASSAAPASTWASTPSDSSSSDRPAPSSALALALERGPGQPQAGRGELVGQTRRVASEAVGVELEIEPVHASQARAGVRAGSVTECAAHGAEAHGSWPSGHRSSRTHSGQRGAREMQTARPCQMSRCDNSTQAGRGTIAMRSRSAFTGSVSAVSPRRRARRPDVRVDGDPLAPAEGVAADDGRRLAADARQPHELLGASAAPCRRGARARPAQLRAASAPSGCGSPSGRSPWRSRPRRRPRTPAGPG